MAARPWRSEAVAAARDYVARVVASSRDDNVVFLASGIAFNILLAAIPFLLLLITGFTYLLPRLLAVDPSMAVEQFVGGLLPVSDGAGAALIKGLLDDVLRTRGRVTVLSAIVFLWLSTRLFGSLRVALADVFDLDRERGMLHGKLFDLGITLVATVLFVASQVATTYMLLGTTRGLRVMSEIGFRADVVGRFEYWSARVLAFAFIAGMFYSLYRYLPLSRVQPRSAWRAALVATVLFEAAKSVARLVLAAIDVSTLYTGTIAALVIVVLWVYYAALIFLVGAEVGHVAELRGRARLLRATPTAGVAAN